MLDPRITHSLHEALDGLARRGELLSSEQLEASYNSFRLRFGPDALRSLDGPTLLNTMHAHGTKESLVYWLEFKDDDEFPGYRLGSIAGGSAHKFGLFRRKDTGQWVTGAPQHEASLSEPDAIVLARKHRDQLLAGVELLEALPTGADDPAYLGLQQKLQQRAPDISRLAWAHKYWSLLFPRKLDDFHNERLQRYNLLRLLQLPPLQDGLYVCASRFVQLAAALGWSLNHLTSALVERNHPPRHHWVLSNAISVWPAMRDGSFAAMGWGNLGDLSHFASGKQTKESLTQLVQEQYTNDAKMLARMTAEIRNFVTRMQVGDILLTLDGNRVLGTGRVTGSYRYDSMGSPNERHSRDVDWHSTEQWNLPAPKGGQAACSPIRDLGSIIEAERHLLDGRKFRPSPTPNPRRALQLDGVPGRIQAILERKGQAIVYGPPGTGKTYWARRAAFDLAAVAAFRHRFAELDPEESGLVQGTDQVRGFVRWCTFHPAYGYEDFIEGFRPQQNASGQLIFRRHDGIFKTLCADAYQAPDRKFFLVVDEINRGDIPRIFGELLTLLELDKRDMQVSLPLSGDRFAVPPNVHLLGTMNTADRSIALLDTALRRRFGFIELMPDASVLGSASAGPNIPLGAWLAALNDRLRAHLGRDARNLQIGHAYLLENGRPLSDFRRFVQVLAGDLVPLLEEYCYDNFAALARILGAGLVDEEAQRVREELFAAEKEPELIMALLAPSPDIVTTTTAAEAAEAVEEESGETEDAEA